MSLEISQFLNFLGKQVPIGTVVIIVLMGFLYSEMRLIKSDMGQIHSEMGHIKEDLSNHITDTNQKIDRLSDRFDKLYHHLLQDKNK